MPTIPGLEAVNWFAIFAEMMYWVGYILLGVIILIGFVMIFYVTQFKLKATVIQLYGSGKDGVFSFGKPKKNRVRWVQQRTAWKSLFPLFNKYEREPFDTEYIYPGNQLYVFELNNEWMPGRINVKQTEQEIRTEINPVPYYIRNWQSLTHKKNAIEFAKHSFWEDNKYFIMGIISVAICAALCGATIWWSFKYATGGTNQIGALTNAIQNMGSIPGADIIPK